MARTIVTTQRTINLDTTEDCPGCGGKIPVKYEGTITVRDSGQTFMGLGTEQLKERVTAKADAEAEAALKPIIEGILSRTPCPGCGQLHPTGVRRKAELDAQAKKNQKIMLGIAAVMGAIMVYQAIDFFQK